MPAYKLASVYKLLFEASEASPVPIKKEGLPGKLRSLEVLKKIFSTPNFQLTGTETGDSFELWFQASGGAGMMSKCHCGRELHYSDPKYRKMVEKIIAVLGENIVVRDPSGKRWSVPRHYIALHGLKADEIEKLGFQEAK